MSVDIYKKEVIDPGDDGSRFAKDTCFASHRNCPAITVVPHQPGNFRGPVGWLWKKHIFQHLMNHDVDDDGNITRWEMMEEMENDGAGGKLQFHALLSDPQTFYGAGREILAMTADDFSRSGRFPAIYANDLNVKRLTLENADLYKSLMIGFGDALRQINGVNITGELAVMKNSITAFCDDGSSEMLIVNWGATCIGLAHRDKLIDGSNIRPGMPIVGFWEPGYRCNGGTLLTNLIQRHFIQLHNPGIREFVAKCAIPSIIYAPFLTEMNGWKPDGSIVESVVDIVGNAHISGSGVWGKLDDILPDGIGAHLISMPEPAPVLREAQDMSWRYDDLRLTDWRAHSTFHGGCGMMSICASDSDADRLIRKGKSRGYQPYLIGVTTESSDCEIIIHSRFKEGKILSSKHPE